MKVNKRRLSLVILLFFLGIQFYRPLRIEKKGVTLDDIILANNPNKEVAELLRNACYDCHSEETKNYWYSNIVPIAWLLDKDIRAGKTELNFSRWESYPFEKKIDLVGEIMHQIYEKKMPLKGYELMHGVADLSKEDQNKITNWLNSLVN